MVHQLLGQGVHVSSPVCAEVESTPWKQLVMGSTPTLRCFAFSSPFLSKFPFKVMSAIGSDFHLGGEIKKWTSSCAAKAKVAE